jgi:hypothetical protein
MTNSDYITPHLMDNAMPSTKGTFSILSTGAIIGYPESSAVVKWLYNTTGSLGVTFPNGKTYIYRGVPFYEVTRLMTANSVGEFINKVIKPNYEFFVMTYQPTI